MLHANTHTAIQFSLPVHAICNMPKISWCTASVAFFKYARLHALLNILTHNPLCSGICLIDWATRSAQRDAALQMTHFLLLQILCCGLRPVHEQMDWNLRCNDKVVCLNYMHTALHEAVHTLQDQLQYTLVLAMTINQSTQAAKSQLKFYVCYLVQTLNRIWITFIIRSKLY